MTPARNAKTIVAERMEKIARQRELLLKLSPQLVQDADNFRKEFGPIIVRNVRPFP